MPQLKKNGDVYKEEKVRVEMNAPTAMMRNVGLGGPYETKTYYELNKEKVKTYAKKYYLDNKEKKRAYYLKNKERILIYNREYKKAKAEKRKGNEENCDGTQKRKKKKAVPPPELPRELFDFAQVHPL